MLMKQLLLTCAAVVLAGLNAFADEQPDYVSTGGNIKWCYIRSVQFADMYLQPNGKEVVAQPKADFTNFENLAKQLWCIMLDENGKYTITNKFDGRQIDVGLSAKYSNWESVQMNDVAATKWIIHSMGGDTIALESELPAPGGGDIYRFPTTHKEGDEIFVWLVRESYGLGHDGNSLFVIEPCNDIREPEYENSERVTYYGIYSSLPEGGMIVDNTSVVDTKYRFTVVNPENADETAQWRFVSYGPGKTAIINRATGNSISTSLYADGKYNLPEADAKNIMPKTWSLNAISNSEFAISATGEDGVVRYLNNTRVGEEPETLDLSQMSGSGFAWTFDKMGEAVDINDAKAETPGISVVNGKIVVEGGKKFTVTTTDGVVLPSHSTLQKGIYLITVEGKTKKINVR